MEKAGGFFVGHVVGNGQDVGFRDDHLFGKGTVAGEAGNPVTRLEASDFLADFNYLARHLSTGRKRHGGLELVLAFNDQGIREVQAGSLNAHLDPVTFHDGAGDVFNHQRLRRAVFLAEDRSHIRDSVVGQSIFGRSIEDNINGWLST